MITIYVYTGSFYTHIINYIHFTQTQRISCLMKLIEILFVVSLYLSLFYSYIFIINIIHATIYLLWMGYYNFDQVL
jgi:hypothetical protein